MKQKKGGDLYNLRKTFKDLFVHKPIIDKILWEWLGQHHLVLGIKVHKGRLQNNIKSNAVGGHKGVVVKVGEESHEELTVKSVNNTTVAGDSVTKIFDLECALETRSKEATKGRN